MWRMSGWCPAFFLRPGRRRATRNERGVAVVLPAFKPSLFSTCSGTREIPNLDPHPIQNPSVKGGDSRQRNGEISPLMTGRRRGQGGEKKKDERRWLQKDWMLCLAGGMMVMNLLGSIAPKAAGGSDSVILHFDGSGRNGVGTRLLFRR